MMGFSPERGGREDTGREALARELAELSGPHRRCVSDFVGGLSREGFSEPLKSRNLEFDVCLNRLRESFGEDLVVEAVLANPHVTREIPFELEISSSRLMRHFESPSRRTFAELRRIGEVLKAEVFALAILKSEAANWPTVGCYHDIRDLVGLLALRFARQPQMLADSLRWGLSILERAYNENKVAGEVTGVLLNEDLLLSTLREEIDLSLPTLSYILRRPWPDGMPSPKPVTTLCNIVEMSASVGRRGIEELFRDSLESSVSIADRRAILKFLVVDGRRFEITVSRTLDPFLRAALTLEDEGFKYVSDHLRTVCSGIADPNSYMGIHVLDRGAGYLLQGEPPDGARILEALRRFHELYPSIPNRFLMVALGQLDGEGDHLKTFNKVCALIGEADAKEQVVAWESMRRGMLSFGHYKESRLIQALQIGCFNTADDAIAFSQYLVESEKLSTIAARYEQALPVLTPNWKENLRELHDSAPRLWSLAISKAYPSAVLSRTGLSTAERVLEGPWWSMAFAASSFDTVSHAHLVPFYQYGYVHWEESSIRHSQETERFIQGLGPPPYETFKSHRYDTTQSVVAEQLRSLTELQRDVWRNDHLGDEVRRVEHGVVSSRRLLITDFPAILLLIGDTPINIESCLSLSSNPATNRAVLALLQDAHQKVALFLDVDRLPDELRNAGSMTPDLLFRYSAEVRRACVCRSVLKIGERSDGSAVLVQAPEYFPAEQRDKAVIRQFRHEIDRYATTCLRVSLFGGLREGEVGEVISMPPSSSSAGQNDDYDGVRWSSCMRGRYQLNLSKR